MTTIKNYDPVSYYEKLTELYTHAASPAMLRRRMQSTTRRSVRWINRARAAAFRTDVESFRDIVGLLRSDPAFRAFHDGTSTALPAYYQRLGERVLGRFAELLSPAERTPDLSPMPARPGHA